MLRQILTSILALSFLVGTASASTTTNLKAAYDDLNYALSVEWDQKDKDFYDQAMGRYQHALEGLRRDGLTNQELVRFTSSQLKDQKLAQELETILAQVEFNKMGPEEANRYMEAALKKSYAKGASWNGDASGYGLFIIMAFFVGAILLVSFGNSGSDDSCKTYENKTDPSGTEYTVISNC